MGFMDRFKDFINAPVEEDDDYGMAGDPAYNRGGGYGDEYEEISSNSKPYSSSGYASSGRTESRRTSEPSYASDEPRRSKVVNLTGGSQLQMVLVKPERFEDGISIADHLNSKRTVVLNLESASREVTRRLVDFLSGVAYANNGQLKRVSNATFVITPNTVDVMGDVLLEEIENSNYHY